MKLEWKKKWLDDRSGHWYSAKVPYIGWEYIVEDVNCDYWKTGVFLSKTDDHLTKISNKDYKTPKNAMNACENHLTLTAKKFMLWITKE